MVFLAELDSRPWWICLMLQLFPWNTGFTPENITRVKKSWWWDLIERMWERCFSLSRSWKPLTDTLKEWKKIQMFPPPDMEEKFLTIPGQGSISSHLFVLLSDHFLCHGSDIFWSHPHLTHLNLEDGSSRLLQNLCNHRHDHMLSPPRRQQSE